MKICNKCGELKPINEFHERQISKDGRHSNCKECRNKFGHKHLHKTKRIGASDVKSIASMDITNEIHKEDAEHGRNYIMHEHLILEYIRNQEEYEELTDILLR